jgi:hypothetical protein
VTRRALDEKTDAEGGSEPKPAVGAWNRLGLQKTPDTLLAR